MLATGVRRRPPNQREDQHLTQSSSLLGDLAWESRWGAVRFRGRLEGQEGHPRASWSPAWWGAVLSLVAEKRQLKAVLPGRPGTHLCLKPTWGPSVEGAGDTGHLAPYMLCRNMLELNRLNTFSHQYIKHYLILFIR